MCARRRRRACFRPRRSECALDRSEDELVDLMAVAEADFELRGMRVDIDELRIERQMQHVGGVPAVVEHVAVAEPYGACEQLVAHAPAVDEPELLVGLRARGGRQGYPTRELHRAGGVVDGNEARDELLSQHLGEALLARGLARRRRRIEQDALAASKTERDIRAGQRQAFQQARDVAGLGGERCGRIFAARGC